MNSIDAKKRVNVMGVLSSIALGFQLVMVMVAVGLGQPVIPGLGIFSFIDILFELGLIIWLFAKKSRTAAVILIAH
jgi:hypothetical protein